MTAVRVAPSAIVSVTVQTPALSILNCVAAPVPVRLRTVSSPSGDTNVSVAAAATSLAQLSPE